MTSVLVLVILAAPSVLAALLLVRAWRSRSRAQLTRLDGPTRLLGVAVGTLPDDRGEWGAAMESELAVIQGSRARWSFAASAARAAFLVAVFSVARRRRLAPSPTIAAAVGAAVAGCIAAVAYLLVKEPSAGAAPRPFHWLVLGAVLADCLWLALTPPRGLITSRTACAIGVVLGFALGAGFLWSTGFPHDTNHGAMGFLILGTILLFFLGSLLAALIDGSFRSGVQTAVWGGTIGVPLIFSIWLVEAVRWWEAAPACCSTVTTHRASPRTSPTPCSAPSSSSPPGRCPSASSARLSASGCARQQADRRQRA